MSNIGSAFRAFFALLGGKLPDDIARNYGFVKPGTAKPDSKGSAPAAKAAASAPVPAPAGPPVRTSDGALQFLGLLQRESRIIDFFQEDISGYDDEQVGAAVRSLHQDCRAAIERHFKLSPVIDGVEGEHTALKGMDPAAIKLVGNVPADGKASGGLLRHKGWKVDSVDLPKLTGRIEIIAPAEIEIE